MSHKQIFLVHSFPFSITSNNILCVSFDLVYWKTADMRRRLGLITAAIDYAINHAFNTY